MNYHGIFSLEAVLLKICAKAWIFMPRTWHISGAVWGNLPWTVHTEPVAGLPAIGRYVLHSVAQKITIDKNLARVVFGWAILFENACVSWPMDSRTGASVMEMC